MTCSVCGARPALLIAPNVLPSALPVYRCAACGVDFLFQPARDDYWQTPGQEEIYDDSDIASERAVLFDRLLDVITSLVPVGSLLDIGAGRGELASAAAARGWRVAALEPSRRAAAALAASGLSEVVNLPLEDFKPSRLYDCVTLIDVLEHMRDPAAGLRKCASCLAPGGLLVVLTPDGGSLVRRLAVALARVPALCGALKYQYYLPHLCYVSARGFQTLAHSCGLQIVRMRRTATPRRFLLAKLKLHYGKYPGNSLLCAALAAVYPLARVFLNNKLLVFARKPA